MRKEPTQEERDLVASVSAKFGRHERANDDGKPEWPDDVPREVVNERGIVERLREAAALPNGLYAEAADTIEGLLAALVEAKLALEYGAGCDENVTYDVAESEIMSWTGSVGAVAYTRIIDAIAKAKGGAS